MGWKEGLGEEGGGNCGRDIKTKVNKKTNKQTSKQKIDLRKISNIFLLLRATWLGLAPPNLKPGL